jgi:aryl carrier-like protein
VPSVLNNFEITQRSNVCNILGGTKIEPYIYNIKDQLANQLPDYMIPKHFILVDKLPLSTSGKLDKKLLPGPLVDIRQQEEYIAPRTDLEKNLCSIWEKILGFKKISINDNFFSIGGDSIKLIYLVSLAHKKGINITIRDVLKHLTIRSLCLNLLSQKKYSNNLYQLIDKHSLDKNQLELDIILPITPALPAIDNKQNLFFIHPGGGLAFLYIPLREYLNCNVFALNNPYFYQPDKFTSVENMAALYLKALLEIQQIGPYNIAGYSFGGLVAYEIGKQLSKLSMEVNKIILLDAPTQIATSIEEEYNHCDDVTMNKQINTNISHFMKLACSYNFYNIPAHVYFLKTRKSPHSLKNICHQYREIIIPGKHGTIMTDHLSSTAEHLNKILSE